MCCNWWYEDYPQIMLCFKRFKTRFPFIPSPFFPYLTLMMWMSLGVALWVLLWALGVKEVTCSLLMTCLWQLMTQPNCRKCWDVWNRCCQERTYSQCAEMFHRQFQCTPEICSSCLSPLQSRAWRARLFYRPGNVTGKHMNLHQDGFHLLGLLKQLYAKWKRFSIEKRRACYVVAFQELCVVSWHACQSDLVYAMSGAWQCF